MKQPDRFDKMAGHMTYTRESLARNIAKLLRAEHRAVVRLVKAEMELAQGQCYAEQRGDALNNMLIALAKRKK
jgi:hypothetical protein